MNTTLSIPEPLGIRRRLGPTLRPLASLAFAARHFRNWPAVWRAGRRGEPLPPLVLRNGMTLHHGPGDVPEFFFREIFLQRCYTGEGFYRPRREDTIVDLGANIGVFMLYMQSLAPGVRMHCYEPARTTRERLLRNISANALGRWVTVHPQAVSGEAARRWLRAAPIAGHRSLARGDEDVRDRGEWVEAVSLREALEPAGDRAVDFLKMDVEGAEAEILEAAGQEALGRVRRVALEFHDNMVTGCRARVIRALVAGGFRIFRCAAYDLFGTIQAYR